MTLKIKKMKTTYKLLIVLLVAVVGILSSVNYGLAQQFAEIDSNDKFYEYDKFSELTFQDLVINGGNRVQIQIEKGESNTLYIHKEITDAIAFEELENCLSIHFLTDYTDSINTPENINGYSRTPKVIITYTDLQKLKAVNSKISLNYGGNKKNINLNCQGSTTLLLDINEFFTGSLNLKATGRSFIEIKQSNESERIEIASIELLDETYLKLINMRTDSLALSMRNESRINCDKQAIYSVLK
jgi:hypothetical protein